LIARLLQELREGRQLRIQPLDTVFGLRIAQNAVHIGKRSRENARSSWGAKRIGAEGVFEPDSFLSKPIQIRRIDQRIASDTHLTMSVVISHHEYDVGRLTAGLLCIFRA